MFWASSWYLSFFLIQFGSADHQFMKQTIKGFIDFNSVHCHILLFTYSDAFYEQKILLDFYKGVIENNYIPTTLENINNKNKKNNAVSSRRQCNTPLRSFIMGNITYIKNYMVDEKRKENTFKEIWLLFITNDFDQEFVTTQIELSIISEVYIARRTTHGYDLWEIYQTAKNHPTRIIYYGNWDANTGFRATSLDILNRRCDFGGAVLRAVVYSQDFWNKLIKKFHKWELMKVVWALLEEDLNFTTMFIQIQNNSSILHFYTDPSHVVIDILAKNEADVSIIPLLPQFTDSVYLDYSKPVFRTNFRVFMKKSLAFDSWFNFFYPLTNEAWYLVITTSMTFSLIIFLMYRIGYKIGLIKFWYNFSDVCIILYQMFCVQGRDLRQQLYSISLLFVVIESWALLIRSMYSANLASTLAIRNYDEPFNSLKELLANGQYELGVQRYSSEFMVYYRTNNSFLKQVNMAVMDQNISNLPSTYLEGLQRICSKEKYAFMASKQHVLESQSKLSCQVHELTHEIYAIDIVYTMAKNNQYLRFINRQLQMFKEFGLIAKLNHDTLRNKINLSSNFESYKSLDLHDTILLQILFIAGIISSLIILFIEILHKKIKKNQRKHW